MEDDKIRLQPVKPPPPVRGSRSKLDPRSLSMMYFLEWSNNRQPMDLFPDWMPPFLCVHRNIINPGHWLLLDYGLFTIDDIYLPTATAVLLQDYQSRTMRIALT
jgi:hypothetical protein